jgi:hypothetical protein
MVFRKGSPSGYLNPAESIVSRIKSICECSPNSIFIGTICPVCQQAECLSADEFKAKNDTDYSPKVKKSTKVYDDLGRLVSDSKGKPKNKPVLIQSDMDELKKKARNLKDSNNKKK